MKWTDLTPVLESGERVIIAVTFESGKKITIRNVPKSVTTQPNFEKQVIAAAKKAKPNEVFTDWNLVGGAQADKIDSTNKGQEVKGDGEGAFEASAEEKEDMKNVLDLHRLVMNTMEKTVWKGLKYNTKDNIAKGLYFLPRKTDPLFPPGVSFEYTRRGKKLKIDDILNELPIELKINTRNPKKDELGYQHSEGWPVYMTEWDDLKQMIIDAVDARENITTVGPSQPEQKVDGPLRIAISPKSFFYRNAVVPGNKK